VSSTPMTSGDRVDITDEVFCIGDTEEEEEEESAADADVDESASKSQLDASTDDTKPEVKSPAVKAVETPAPKIASPVQQVMLHM